MKNIQFLFCLLFSSVTLYSMESSNGACHDENNLDAKEIIKNDFKKYLGNRLTAYKKQSFTYNDIDDIKQQYTAITNKVSFSFLNRCLHRDVVDEEGNTFVHLAIKNRDLKMVEWAVGFMKYPLSTPNATSKEPIDLCIDQLMPQAEGNKEEAHRIFNALIAGYHKVAFDYNNRRSFLKKIVTLEFEHIKNETHFVIEENMLQCFLETSSVVQQKLAEEPIVLSEIYQEVCDEDENTFTHMLVAHHLPDLLYTFIGKDYVTFAENKNNLNPLVLARNIFLAVAHNLLDRCAPNKDFIIAAVSQEEINKKCCYLMLLNFLKKNDDADFKQCCDKHSI